MASIDSPFSFKEKGSFSLLSKAHRLPNLSHSLSSLTFPELLIHLPIETHSQLSKEAPCFTPLNGLIQALKEHREESPLFSQIRSSYKYYRNYLINSQGETRLRLIEGPPRLFALFNEGKLLLFSFRAREEPKPIGALSMEGVELPLPLSQAALATLFPHFNQLEEGLLIDQISPFGALRCWLFQKGDGELLEPLLTQFPKLLFSDELIALLGEEESLEFIRVLANRGGDLRRGDRRGRTPLHHATLKGSIDNIRALIQAGVEINLCDLDGRSPLHLATLRGDLPLIQTLLEMGGDPNLLTSDRENLLHLAANQGKAPLFSFLLTLPSAKEWLLQGELAGNSPLHRALCLNAPPETIHLLIQAGAPLDLPNNEGDRPLHVASKSGHSTNVWTLLEAGAQLELVNREGKSALDLALEWGHDELVWLFLGGESAPQAASASSSTASSSTPPSPPSSSSSPLDFEGAHYRTFEAAYHSKNVAQQIFSLEKLALIYLERGDFIKAAHLLNGAAALAIDPSINPHLQPLIFAQLERIEGLFLFHKFGVERRKEVATPTTQLRQELQKIREKVAERLEEEGLEVEEVQELLTKSYQALLSLMIDECIALLGQGYPECFAVMGLGSMARREMCPYSDLEFAFLIPTSSEENLAYFRDLNELLTLRVINLGETSFNLIREGKTEKSLVPAGFSVDRAGLSPEGVREVYELIGTPKELAYFQTEEWFSQHDSQVILVNAMRTVSCVMGDAKLVDSYKREISRHLDRRTGDRVTRLSSDLAIKEMKGFLEREKSRREQSWPDFDNPYLPNQDVDDVVKGETLLRRVYDSLRTPLDLSGRFFGSPLREHRALELMRGYLEEFNPKLDQTIALRAFDVKNQLYRLPQSTISALALFYNLKSNNTLEQIDELQEKDLLSKKGGDELKSIMRFILKLRIKTHLFYQNEKEILYHSQENAKEKENLFLFNPRLIKIIKKIYNLLIPLHESLIEFTTDNPLAFRGLRTNLLRSEQPEDSRIYVITEFSPFAIEQREIAKQSLALNPNSPAACSTFGVTQHELGNPQEAIRHLEEALSLLNEKHQNQPHYTIGAVLRSLAGAYRLAGAFNKAIDLYNDSITIYQRVYNNKPHRDLGHALSDLGELYAEIDQPLLAAEYYSKSYKVYNTPTIKRTSEKELARIESRRIHLYFNLNGFDRAIQEYTKLLNNPSLSDLDRAFVYQSLGEAHLELGELEKSVFHFNLSERLYKEVYRSTPHPIQAAPLIGLARARAGLKELSSGFSCCHQALELMRSFYEGRPHPSIAEGLNALGELYEMSGELEQAVENYNASLSIMREFYQGRAHRKTAAILKKLGAVYLALNQLPKGVECCEEALSITRSFYQGQPHNEAADLLMQLGELYLLSEESLKAIQHYEYALEETRLVNGDFPAIAICELLTKLKDLYSSLGDSEGAKRSSSLLRSYHLAAGNYAIERKEFEIAIIAYAAFFKQESDEERVSDLESADAYIGLGVALRRVNKLDDAAETLETALDLYDSLNGDPLKRARLIKRLGTVYSELGLFENASGLLEEALAIYRELSKEDTRTILKILFTLSSVYTELEDVEKAKSHFEELISIQQSSTDELIHRFEALEASLKIEDKSSPLLLGSAPHLE